MRRLVTEHATHLHRDSESTPRHDTTSAVDPLASNTVTEADSHEEQRPTSGSAQPSPHSPPPLSALTATLASIPLDKWETATPTLDALIRETLRVAEPHVAMRQYVPPTPPPHADAEKAGALYLGGKAVPPGAFVMYPFSDVHLSSEIYREPWRWDPGRTEMNLKAPYAYVGMGAGTCLSCSLLPCSASVRLPERTCAVRPCAVRRAGTAQWGCTRTDARVGRVHGLSDTSMLTLPSFLGHLRGPSHSRTRAAPLPPPPFNLQLATHTSNSTTHREHGLPGQAAGDARAQAAHRALRARLWRAAARRRTWGAARGAPAPELERHLDVQAAHGLVLLALCADSGPRLGLELGLELGVESPLLASGYGGMLFPGRALGVCVVLV